MDADHVDSVFDWPEALQQGRVDDAAFAAAYARVPDGHRAWIKTCLAGVYAAWGGPMPFSRAEELRLGHDLRLLRRDRALDFALIACGPSFASPARLAAAVIPALCARVPEVAAVRVGRRWPHALLTTLELCGVETVARVGAQAFAGLIRDLAGMGRGAVVFLDGVAEPAGIGPGLRTLPARINGRAGLFPASEADFDRQALAFAHPDMEFYVHGDPAGPVPLAPPFAAAPGGLAEAASLGYDALYLAGDHLDQGLGAAPLVLGPGRETFWLWPNISPEAFRARFAGAGVAHPGFDSGDAVASSPWATNGSERS